MHSLVQCTVNARVDANAPHDTTPDMTAYCLMQRVLKHDETHGNCRGARFAPGVGYFLLADGRCGDWGSYAYGNNGAGDWSPDATLSDRLMRLIECARRFPPAVALARADLRKLRRTRPAKHKDELIDEREVRKRTVVPWKARISRCHWACAQVYRAGPAGVRSRGVLGRPGPCFSKGDVNRFGGAT
jgi:hypothetical protein